MMHEFLQGNAAFDAPPQAEESLTLAEWLNAQMKRTKVKGCKLAAAVGCHEVSISRLRRGKRVRSHLLPALQLYFGSTFTGQGGRS